MSFLLVAFKCLCVRFSWISLILWSCSPWSFFQFLFLRELHYVDTKWTLLGQRYLRVVLSTFKRFSNFLDGSVLIVVFDLDWVCTIVIFWLQEICSFVFLRTQRSNTTISFAMNRGTYWIFFLRLFFPQKVLQIAICLLSLGVSTFLSRYRAFSLAVSRYYTSFESQCFSLINALNISLWHSLVATDHAFNSMWAHLLAHISSEISLNRSPKRSPKRCP